MSRNAYLLAALSVALAVPACSQPESLEIEAEAPVASLAAPALIPAPAHLETRSGAFALGFTTPILPQGEAEAAVADWLAGELRATTDWRGGGEGPAIHLAIDPALEGGEESYQIEITADGISVRAPAEAGLFYGAVSLWQMATPWPVASDTHALPALSLDDAPHYAWRGVLLDSARHMQSVDFIKRFIDWMALHKLNTLHWHLTDDQGWRLEVLQYPRLTEAGAWRVPAGEAPARDIDPATGEPRRYGGFYTQDEVREIVAYAQARQITIVPEIDVPGHALAAIVAYPELGVTENTPTEVMSDWGVYPWLFNVDEPTFEFLENVLDEVMDLFPGTYIHIGGDEAPKNQWRESAAVQARMAELGLADEDALQGYFTHRLDEYLTAHGRRLVGWDEIVEGGLSPNATVMSWRGLEGAEAAAEAGLDAIIAPNSHYYLDYRQSALPSEPTGRGRMITLEDLYTFDPFGAELDEEVRNHVLGLQANLWTEHMRTEARLTHMAFPRLAALAERAWSAEADFGDFLARLSPMMERYALLGLDAADSAFRPAVTLAATEEGYRVHLSSQTGYGEIRYTLNGATPDQTSELYVQPLELDHPVELRAVTLDGTRALSDVVARSLDRSVLDTRADSELETCGDALVLVLDDDAPVRGERDHFIVDIMDPCWIWPDADTRGVEGIEVEVGQVPYNFQLMADIDNVRVRPMLGDTPELIVRAAGCEGEIAARLDISLAEGNPEITALNAPFSASEEISDLCFTFHTGEIDPLWTLAHVTLQRAVGGAE